MKENSLWIMPRKLRANFNVTRPKCGCLYNLTSDNVESLIQGEVLECSRCHQPIYLDDSWYVTDGRRIKIVFGIERYPGFIDLWHSPDFNN